jgi:DNA-binding MarR family transcriptional regulator
MADSQPERTDFAVLVVAATHYVARRLDAAVAAAGIEGMRTPYGFVIRALHDSPLTLTALAERLRVTKQAAIKVVDEMETRGFLTRHPDPDDRRVKLLRLTDKGRTVRRAALSASHGIERELRRELGDPDVDALRTALESLLERHAALEDARAGRSRAPW